MKRSHPGSGRSVATAVRAERVSPFSSDAQVVVGCYFQGQPSEGEPDHYRPLEEVKTARQRGEGVFINRGRAFRFFTTCTPRPQPDLETAKDRNWHAGPLSLHPDANLIQRFAENDAYAVAAINGWC